MRKYIKPVICILLFPLVLFAQTNAQPTEPEEERETETTEGVLMLDDMLIEVAPEIPTVVVAIPRQKPRIEPVTLQSPVERMLKEAPEDVKPKLSDMKISKVEKPEKMLAKERNN